jgi:hypothetical protein
MKKLNRYQVRHYPTPSAFSEIVGRFGTLHEYRHALAIVRRLKKSGVDAFAEKFEITA